jgi:zinc protease
MLINIRSAYCRLWFLLAIKYDGERPAEVLAEDRTIAVLKLNIPADRVTITPVAEVFAK